LNDFQLGKKRSNDIVRFVEDCGAITISQCAALFYPHAKTAYKIAQRKLSKLVEKGYLKVSKNDGNENVYYIDKKLSRHSLFINSFLIALIKAGATNIYLEKDKTWINNKIKSDAFFEYDYLNYHYYNILEICCSHKYIPIKEYELLFKSGEAHNICRGTFPRLIVMDDVIHKEGYYHSNYFQVIQIDLNLNKFPAIFVD
jgi:hypothetical protein